MQLQKLTKAVITTALLLGISAQAWAHTALSSSNPAEGTSLEAAPKTIEMTSARIAADANLQSQVDFITSNTDPAALDSLTEIVSAFQSSDSDMSALIASNTTAISNEATTRVSAD